MHQRWVNLLCIFTLASCGEKEMSICDEIPNLEICTGAQACIPGEVKECPCGNDISGVQTCNEEGTGLSDCECFSAPVDTVVAEEEDAIESSCETNYYTDCVGDDLYWFDSCDERGDLVESCEAGQCAAGAESCCPGKVPACYQEDIYWFDSCGVLLEIKETCGGESSCKEGETENDPPTCVAAEACDGPTYEACHNPSPNPNAPDSAGHVFTFNSCDEPMQMVTQCDCEEMCNQKNCVKTFWDGKWTVNLSGGCGLGSPLPYTNVVFDVSGSDISVVATVNGKQVDYIGSMECDDSFVIEGSLTTDSLLGGSMTVTETWNCQFNSPFSFTGTLLENIPGVGSCQYTIDGYRN